MQLFRLPFFAAALAVLIAAPAAAAPLSSEAAPSASKAYVGGAFTTELSTFTSAFVLTNQETGRGYYLPFSSHLNTHAGNAETLLVDIPPGAYRVTDWIVYNSYWGPSFIGREFKAKLSDSALTQPFKLAPGDVLFLGRFATNNSWKNGYVRSTTYGEWRGEPITEPEARADLAAAYPAFTGAKLTCLTCLPSAAAQGEEKAANPQP